MIVIAASTGAGGLIDFFVTGGVFMIPLLFASVVSGAVIFLRSRALREDLVLPPALINDIERMQPGEHPIELAKHAFSDPSPLARVLRVALANLRWPKAENIESVQTRARQEMLSLEKGLVVLELVVGLGPLLGLLGAVSGLVGVFGSLDPTGMGANASGVARGISEALHTTIMGLAVAIPSLVAHSYFSKKVEVIAVQMESLVSELLAKCYGDHPTQPSAVALDLSEWIQKEKSIEKSFVKHREATQRHKRRGSKEKPTTSNVSARSDFSSHPSAAASQASAKSLADLRRETENQQQVP
jgi:biopolymer transport protein ExbB